MVKLSPSLLSANFANLQDDLDKTKGLGIEMLHIDVMDGIFVPNISFAFKVISDIRGKNDYFFDTHLMIEEPIRYIDDFKKRVQIGLLFIMKPVKISERPLKL